MNVVLVVAMLACVYSTTEAFYIIKTPQAGAAPGGKVDHPTVIFVKNSADLAKVQNALNIGAPSTQAPPVATLDATSVAKTGATGATKGGRPYPYNDYIADMLYAEAMDLPMPYGGPFMDPYMYGAGSYLDAPQMSQMHPYGV